MPSNYWTDPRGGQHAYTNQNPSNIGDRFGRAIERGRTWGGIDPTFDGSKQQVGPNGEIADVGAAFNPWLAAATLGGPLALGMMMPAGMAAGAGGAGATGAGAGAATTAGTSAAAGGLSGALKGLVTDPNNLMSLAGVIAALAGGASGGNGQASADAQRLNQITEQRMRRVDPLHQAVTQLAWNRLPINARQGISAPTYSPLP